MLIVKICTAVISLSGGGGEGGLHCVEIQLLVSLFPPHIVALKKKKCYEISQMSDGELSSTRECNTVLRIYASTGTKKQRW